MTPDLGGLRPALDAAQHIYVGILTKSGPHVTPELFTVSGGRLLCMTAASTLKVKILQRRPIAAVAAAGGRWSLTGLGRVEVLDPADPRTALGAPGLAAQAPLGVARFVRDNAAELAGAAVQAVTGKLGTPLPPRRVVLAVTLTSAALLDGDDVVLDEGWDSQTGASSTGGADDSDAPDLSALPESVRDLAVTGSAVVGWTRTDGTPLALPATWDSEAGVASVPSALFRASGAVADSEACVTFDRWTGYGPEGKQGVLLRGTGRAVDDGAQTRVTLDVTRASHWDGIEVGSTNLDPSPGD